jgi:uncharacterized protein (TIGR02145 family)
MTNALPGVESVIASDFSGTVTSSAMASNKWGYSLNNTDFSKIPTQSAQTTIKNIDHFPAAAEKTTTVNIGMKVDTNIPSGTYSKNVVFSAIAHATPIPKVGIFSITDMQDMTSAICAENTTPAASATDFDWDGSHNGDTGFVPRTVLTDTRDGSRYLVSKLADGNCWMSQNLGLDLVAGNEIIISNNNGTTSTTTPDVTTLQTAEEWPMDDAWNSYRPGANLAYFRGGTSYNSSSSGTGDEYLWEKTGNYYTFYAATGGTAPRSGEAPSSICPRGWRLPTYSGVKSFENLASVYTDRTSAHADPLNFIADGHVSFSDGILYNYYGQDGMYWTSLGTNASGAAAMQYDLTWLSDSRIRYEGYNVRCVAI